MDEELEALVYIYNKKELRKVSDDTIELKLGAEIDELIEWGLKADFLEEQTYIEEEESRRAAGGGGDDDEEEEEALQSLLLFSANFTFPPEYPETACLLTSLLSSLLSEDELEGIRNELSTVAKDSIGDAMIYTLGCWLREKIEQVIRSRVERDEREAQELKEKLELEESIRYQGTKVTRDTFKVWQASFVQEAKNALKASQRGGSNAQPLSNAFQACLAVQKLIHQSAKLTGRQLFESADGARLVNSDLTAVDADDDAVVEIDHELMHSLNLRENEENEEEGGMVFEEED